MVASVQLDEKFKLPLSLGQHCKLPTNRFVTGKRVHLSCRWNYCKWFAVVWNARYDLVMTGSLKPVLVPAEDRHPGKL